MSSDKDSLEKASDGMEVVQLHRASSMVQSSNENEKNTPHQIIIVAPRSRAALCCSQMKELKVELVMFLYMFSSIMRHVSTATMIIDKVCLAHLNYAKNVCDHLEDNPTIKSEVEKLANNYSVGHSMVQMLPSCFLACFIGAWSDRYSRKIPMVAALIGMILDGLGTSICAYFLNSRVEYMFIPAVITGFSGGMISVLMVIFSYAADTTTANKRTLKYAFLEMSFGLSMPLGQLSGGWLYRYSGYIPVFLTSTGGHIFCLAWVMFVLQETKGLDCTDSWRVKLRNLWSFQPVMESFRATMKIRPNQGRKQILLIILAMSVAVLNMASAGSISFLYVHHVYNWGNTKYSTISAVFAVIGMTAMLIAVPIFKKLRLGDAALGIVGNTALLVKSVTMGLATKKEVYFLAQLLGLLGGIGTLAGRSRISKVTSEDDLGKVFAFLTTAETILPIAATAVVSQIFNATLDVYPGIVFLGMGVLLLIPVAIYVWLASLPAVNYEEMKNPPQHVDVENTIKITTSMQNKS